MRKIAFILSALALAASIVFCVSCGNNSKGGKNYEPAEFADKLMSFVQAGDMESYYELSGTTEEQLAVSYLSQYILNDEITSYFIVTTSIDQAGESAEVIVSCKAKNAGEIFFPVAFVKVDNKWELTY